MLLQHLLPFLLAAIFPLIWPLHARRLGEAALNCSVASQEIAMSMQPPNFSREYIKETEEPAVARGALQGRHDRSSRQIATAGGLPGPQFQALPEPAPLPPLPRPAQQLQTAMPEEASSMAPMAAPAGEASAQYQVYRKHCPRLHAVLVLLNHTGHSYRMFPHGQGQALYYLLSLSRCCRRCCYHAPALLEADSLESCPGSGGLCSVHGPGGCCDLTAADSSQQLSGQQISPLTPPPGLGAATSDTPPALAMMRQRAQLGQKDAPI